MSTKACCHCNRVEGTVDERYGRKVELRPYGPNGAYVCFPCAMMPKNKAETERQFERKFESAGSVAMLTPEGPIPYLHPRRKRRA